MAEGFFDRWSRRKQQVRAGERPAEPEPVSVPLPELKAEDAVPETVAEAAAADPGLPQDAEETKAQPTLAHAQALGIDSDFKPFIAEGVAPEVRNTAFRKLFADPHFNEMDGLDTYVDDYSKPSPLPDSVLRQMASAKFLKLFDEEPEETPGDDGLPDVAKSENPGATTSPPVASAQPASQETDDHHADLRLQPDHAPRAEDARDGTG
jgi:hypothetical protein